MSDTTTRTYLPPQPTVPTKHTLYRWEVDFTTEDGGRTVIYVDAFSSCGAIVDVLDRYPDTDCGHCSITVKRGRVVNEFERVPS